MKKLSLCLAVLVLSVLSRFNQICGQNTALDNLQKSIYFFEGSKKDEILISVPDHSDVLTLDITSTISMGNFSIEINDPDGNTRGKFSIASQLNSEKLKTIKSLSDKHVTLYSSKANDKMIGPTEDLFKRYGFTDEAAQGKISRSIKNPIKGNWVVMITSKDAKGLLIMDTNQKFFLPGNPFTSSSENKPGKTISGIITDENNRPASGAIVTVKGAPTGAVTDDQGNFVLSIPENSKTLLVSYKSFPIKEVAIGDQTKLVITIK
jgi:hypothetical protein